MNKDISVIVEEVRQKEKEGDKELINYLQGLDISSLNKLLYIFNGGPTIQTPMQIFQMLLIPLSLFNGVIIIFMLKLDQNYGFWSNSNFDVLKLFIGVFLGIYGLVNFLQLRRGSKEPNIVTMSSKMGSKQKIITTIRFILEEKYRGLLY